jgi:hypothetical protein
MKKNILSLLFCAAMLFAGRCCVFAEISDGASGGNEHFFFLPPIVSEHSSRGTFADSLAPVVQICEWAETGCVLPPIAEFTTTTVPDSEKVRIVPEEEYYVVIWHPKRIDRTVYRIRVLFRTQEGFPIEKELGHVDVIFCDEACPIKFRIEKGFFPLGELAPMERAKISPVLLEQFIEEDVIEPVEALVNVLDDQVPLAGHNGVEILTDYRPTLAKVFVRISNQDALAFLAQSDNIVRIHENKRYKLLSQTDWWQDNIGQPSVQRAGYIGTGMAVAILDDGGKRYNASGQLPDRRSIDLSIPAFGECTDVGTPACCSVVADVNPYWGDPYYTDHMTQVAERVALVAPGADLIAVDVGFEGEISWSEGWLSDNLVAEGLEWVLEHKDEYNIVAVNMSFGTDADDYGVFSTEECPDDNENEFQRLREAGIMPIAGAGNDGYWQSTNNDFTGISYPACSPLVVSVSSSTREDSILGDSTIGPNVDLLAPGPEGTSIACPTIAGSWAILREARPDLSLDETLELLKTTGVPIYDPETGLTFPRIQLDAALGITAIKNSADSKDLFGQAVATGDFNGDGYDDVAIGVPGEEHDYVFPCTNPGAVNILYGCQEGLTRTGNKFLRILPGEPYEWRDVHDQPPPECSPYRWMNGFGSSLATGDFDGDGYYDLAVGVPGVKLETNFSEHSGAVMVYYGSEEGLSTERVQNWDESKTLCQAVYTSPWAICIPVPGGEAFGYSLAAGDFNGDDKHDLAIGVPEADRQQFNNVGSVYVLYGTTEGLDNFAGTQLWWQDDIPEGAIEADSEFGFSLAAGDINNDGNDDLVIGSPFKSVGGYSNSGAVTILYGEPSGGLSASGAQYIDDEVIFGTARHNTRLGRAIAIGDFDGYDGKDLAIGSDKGSSSDLTGFVYVFPSTTSGLLQMPTYLFYPDLPGSLYDYDFGAHLAAGDFDGNGRDDLAIVNPSGEINGKVKAGKIWVYYAEYYLLIGETQLWHQDLPGLWESAEEFDNFGGSLASGDFNNDGVDDLVIGVAQEDLVAENGTFRYGCEAERINNAGVVHIIYGTVAEGLYALTDPAPPDAPTGAKKSQILTQGK